ncbi:MAG: substrate-binding domain-containing protein [Alphaproteobacteria bacterium]
MPENELMPENVLMSENELMTVREVAAYLRIKERRVYDLVKAGAIPCTRVTGKWLFPRAGIDRWLAEHAGGMAVRSRPPAVIAGSHDPLLDWAARESGSGLALLASGSLDGIARLAAGEAAVAAVHVRDAATGAYNVPLIARELAGRPVVALTWAWRQQGLVVAPGNPLGVATVADLAKAGVRVAMRQPGAGSQVLLLQLLAAAGVDPDVLVVPESPARTQTDLAFAVREGRADAGLAVAAAAGPAGLGFVPLVRERFDLVLDRRDAFEPPFRRLMAFAATEAFAHRARAMGGYDVAELGTVIHNGP